MRFISIFTLNLFIFLLYSANCLKDNPNTIPGLYGKSVESTNNNAFIIGQNSVYDFSFTGGLTTTSFNLGSHQKELGASSIGTTLFKTSLSGSGFIVKVKGGSDINPSSSTFTCNTISLFKIGGDIKGYAAWTNNRVLHLMSFSLNSSTKNEKSINTFNYGENINCLGFPTGHFGCTYNEYGAQSGNKCYFQEFDQTLTEVGNSFIVENQCESVYGQKLFALSESTSEMFLCFVNLENKLFCLKALHSIGGFQVIVASVQFLLNVSNDLSDFEVGRFSTYFILAAVNQSKLQLLRFDSSLNIIGESVQLTDSWMLKMVSVTYVNEYMTMLTYSRTDLRKTEYRLIMYPKCTSYSDSTTINNELKINLDRSITNNDYTGFKIQILSKPSSGTLLYKNDLNEMVEININQLYTITSTNAIYFRAEGDTGTFDFDFRGVNDKIFTSDTCEANIIVQPCYFSCYTCSSSLFSDNDHKCSKCDEVNGYYKIDQTPSTPNNCVNRQTAPNNFYLDTGTKTFKKCNDKCATCEDDGPDKCKKCASGYHWTNIQRIDCTQTQPAGYYLNTIIDIFFPCYNSCKDCNGEGDELKHNCNSCKNNYHTIIDIAGNCYNDSTKPEGYYLSTTDNKYLKCNEQCKNCNGGADSCSECADGFFFSQDKKKCWNEATKDSNTYLDNSNPNNIVFKPCDTSCATCSWGKVGTVENCLTCQGGKFLFGSNCLASCPSSTFSFQGVCVTKCPKYTAVVNSGSKKSCDDCAAQSKYLYQGTCSSSQPAKTFVANSKYKYLEDCYTSCATCTNGGTYKKMNCGSCATGYKPLEDDKSQCFDKTPDYYFEKSGTYHRCYSSCLTCSDSGTEMEHNCITCRKGYSEDPYNYPQKHNCVENCPLYWYKDIVNQGTHVCTDERKCPKDYPYLVEETKECVSLCSNTFYYTLDNTCVKECPQNSIKSLQNGDKTCYTSNNPEKLLKNGLSNAQDFDSLALTGSEGNFHSCNSEEQSSCDEISQQLHLTIANLTNCFVTLRKVYGLNEADYLYYGIFEKVSENLSVPSIHYEIYDSSFTKIYDTSYCVSNKINMTKYLNPNNTAARLAIEVYKNDKLDIVNHTSSFFKDICKRFTYEEYYDVLLNDRYDYFYKNLEYSFCEDNCKLVNISLNTSTVTCECENFDNVLETVTLVSQKAHERTYKDKQFQHIKCYKLVFSLDIFKKNTGNYFILIFIIFEIIFCIYFYKEGRKGLFSFLHDEILLEGNDAPEIPENSKIEEENNESNSVQSQSVNQSVSLNASQIRPAPNPPKVDDVLNKVKGEQNPDGVNEGEEYAKVFIMNPGYDPNEDNNNNNITPKRSPDKASSLSETTDRGPHRRSGIVIPTGLPGMAGGEGGEDSEANQLAHELKLRQKRQKFEEEIANKYEDTSFKFLYWYALKRKHRILSLFFYKDIYEIFSFKFSFLIFVYSMDFFCMTVLSLNFHLRYLYHKRIHVHYAYDITFGILSALMSYLICKFIWWLIEYKSELKRYEAANEAVVDKKEYYMQMNKLVNSLQVKIKSFYVFCFFFLVFNWYFVTSFCATYSNSQLAWGVGVLTNFIFSLVFPIPYYAVFAALQSLSLKNFYMGLYNFSSFMLKL